MRAVFSCLLVALAASATTAGLAKPKKNKVEAAFEKSKIVPEVINVAPKYLFEMQFASNVVPNLGNVIIPAQVAEVPTELRYPADSKCYYTVMLIDADSCEDPDMQFLHMLYINIPGSRVDDGELLADYVKPEPQKEGGRDYHRIIALVYKQPKMLSGDKIIHECTAIDDRDSFSIRQFVKRYRLGNPIAGNFFMGKFEDCPA